MFSAADDKFFSRIKSNSLHVLQPYLPDYNDIPYQLRARSHLGSNQYKKAVL